MKKIVVIIGLLICVIFLYFGAKGTYTSYETNTASRVENNISDIHLKINGEEVGTDAVLDSSIILDNISWTNTHTREKKISPGSTGSFQFDLDPTGSEVAILYELQFVDKIIDEDKILTFDNITCDHTLIKTDKDIYSGIISLDDIDNNEVIHVNVNFYFDSSTDIEGYSTDNQVYEEFFEIHFHALQYKGEDLIPYSEGD